MNSENNSYLDLQAPMSTMNRENGGFAQPLLTYQMTTEREKKTQNFTSQQNYTQNAKQQEIGDTVGKISDVQKYPSDILIKQVQSSTSQNKIEANPDLPEFSHEQSNIKSARKIGFNYQQQYQGGSIAAGSNQSSQNFIVSPSNTFLLKEGDDTQNMLGDKQYFETGGFNKSSINKLDFDSQQKQGSNHQQDDNINYNNSQSIKTVNTFLDKLTFKSKTKTTSQHLAPSVFLKSGGLSRINTIAPEKSVEQNLTKMVKFVKLKKKIAEMKRFFLRSTYYKLFMQQFDGNFTRVIDDPSSSFMEDTPQGLEIFNSIMNTKFFQLINDILKAIPTIEPSSKFKLVWDLVIGTVFMTYFFFIPIHVAINVSIHNLITQYVGYILHFMMVFDIIFSMITGYFEKGVNTSDKKKILINYIKNYFWSDILSQIPLLVSELGDQDSQVEKIFVLCFFVKLRNFQKIFRKFEDSFHLAPSTSNIISLVKLILTILFFSHIFGCIWLFVGKQQRHVGTNWLRKIDMEDADWVNQYIAAYYFSTVTMITVGYGDISPMNNLERIICMGTMLISCVIFAYTINQIGTIFSDLFSQDRQMKEFFYIINDYMDNKGINFSLQYKIREYLDYYWREQDQNKSELEKRIIDSLSDQLREKLMIEANRIVLKNYGIFSNNFHNSVILKMIPIIQTLHTTPNQIIFSEGQLDSDMFMYFIEKGKIEICREYDKGNDQRVSKSIINLGPGSCFGAYSFFTNNERREMARSLEFSKLLLVKRSEFLKLISQMPQEMEKFNQIKDTIIFENNLEYLEVKCLCCGSCNHEIQHCHFFHYQPDNYGIIKKDNMKYQSQSRDTKFSRKRLMSYKNLILGIEQEEVVRKYNIFVQKWKSQNQETLEQYQQQYLVIFNDYFDQNNYYQDEALYDDFYEEGLRDDSQDQGSEDEEDEINDDNDEESDDDSSNSFKSDEDQQHEGNKNKMNKKQRKVSRNNPSTIREETENDISQSAQQPKRSNMEKINEELNMSIKNSDEIEGIDQCEQMSPYQNENVREQKRQISHIISKMQFSKLTDLIEQDESTPSNNLIGSDRGSTSNAEKQRLEKLLYSLAQNGNSANDEIMATSNYYRKESIPLIPLSNKSIQMRNQNKTSSLIQQVHSPQSLQQIGKLSENYDDRASTQELNQRRPGFKQLTVVTNKNSSEAGSMRTLSKIPGTIIEQNKRISNQLTLKNIENEISFDKENLNDLSPQLIFIAGGDSDKEDKQNPKKLIKENNFIFETINLIDDFNFELDQEKQESSREIININQPNPPLIKKISNLNNNKNVIPINGEEQSKERKVKKQKSVRINELNENQIRRKSSKRSQSHISVTEFDGTKKLKRKSESNFPEQKEENQVHQKRRKSSRLKGSISNDLNLAIEDHSKSHQENLSPLKKNKIESHNLEKRKKRNSQQLQPGFELIRNISTLTDQMQNENSGYQVQNTQISDKNKRKSHTKLADNEIYAQDQHYSYSPNIQRRQHEILEKQKSQSFKNLGIYTVKSNQDKPNIQLSNQQMPMQGSKGINQIQTSLSSRMSQNGQSTHNQSNNLPYGQSTLQDITSQNSLPANLQSQTKLKNKQEKKRTSQSNQAISLQNDLLKQEINPNSQTEIQSQIRLQRKDSTDSQRSNSSSNIGGGNQQGVKKKSVFSVQKSKSKLISQSSFSKQTNIVNIKQNQPQYLSPYPQSNNLLNIQGLKHQNSNLSNRGEIIPPPSPLISPSNQKSAGVKNKVLSFINKAKIATLFNKSVNESISSLQKSKQGENSPKSTLSTKQLMILNQMMNPYKLDSCDDLNYQQRKNMIDQQNIVNARKQSSVSINSVSSIQQIRANIHGLGRSNFKPGNEISTPILKVSGETIKGSQGLYQGRQLQNINMKQSLLGLPIQMQQSQYNAHPIQFQLKDRSPTQIQPNEPLINLYQNNNAQTYMSLNNQTPLPVIYNQQSTQQFNNNEFQQNYNYDESNIETIFNIMSFDEMKVYQHYFTKGNCLRVINKANIIISRNFIKFMKNLKKQKQQKRKQEENKEVRRGSFYLKKQQQLQKKKSYGVNDLLNTVKSQAQNGGGDSDEKTVGRARGSSLALNPHNLEDSNISNESDVTQNKISQRGSPQFKDQNLKKFNSEGGDKILHNPLISNINSIHENKKLQSPIPKSIFNRQNNHH